MSLFDDAWRDDADPAAPKPAPAPEVHSVSQVVELLREVVENSFWSVAVKGEVSRPVRPASGHIYLTLKDAQGVLPVIVWRTAASRIDFELREGMQVTAWGKLTVYGPQGKYQLVAERMEAADGLGALAAAFEATKRKLGAEGLFAPERKRGLPFRPRRIAVVTSATGAVVHDIIDTLMRRCPRVEVVVFPVRVQGDRAAVEVAAALRKVRPLAAGTPPAGEPWGRGAEADVCIVARGGGSLEDLWPFNDERVARAVIACAVPVVSAVGHETDFTICDFAADVRAKTPTEAAYLVVPDLTEEREMVAGLRRSLERAVRRRVEGYRVRLQGLGRSEALAGPRHVIRLKRQKLDELFQRAAAWLRGNRHRREQVEELCARMRRQLPAAGALRQAAVRLLAHGRLELRRQIARDREAAERAAAHLRAVSPEAVLARGFSITRDAEGKVLRTSAETTPGQEIETWLASGKIWSQVRSSEV